MYEIKKIPIFICTEMTQKNYNSLTYLAAKHYHGNISATIADLIEYGLLTIREYDKNVVVD